MGQSSKSSRHIAQLSKIPLKKVLGVLDLSAIGYGDLGSSIFYALGITALFALGATPIALGLAGIVFVCTALTFAEMTSTFHESGGSASFARHAFNDLISFIAGWGLLLDYIVTIAISAFAVAPYLAYFSHYLNEPHVQIIFAIGLLAILFLINLFGVKQSTKVSLVLTSFTIVTQIVIIVIGLIFLLNFDYIWEHIRINIAGADWSPTWPEFWKGTAMAMVAYTGIESIAQLSSETKRPAKSVPRAIILTMFVIILLYLGISIVALSAMKPQELGTQYLNNSIAGIVDHLPFGGSLLGPWVGVLAAALLFVASNAGLIGASRLSFNMGEYYQLPRFFYHLQPRFRTPYVSLAFFTLLAALVIVWSRGQMTFLADLYNFGAMIAFFSTHMSLIVLRIKRPDLHRPFKVGLNIPIGKYEIPLPAVIGALSTLSVWILVVITKPDGHYLGLAWMIFGIAMFYFYRRRAKIAPTGKVAIEKIKIPDYRPLKVDKILVPTRAGIQTETVQMACEMAKMHGASVTAIQVIEVPYSMPLDINLPHRIHVAQAILHRAEAIAREFGVSFDTEIVRARSIADAILEHAEHGRYDLIILGAAKTHRGTRHPGFGSIIEKILRKAHCRVIVSTIAQSRRGSTEWLMLK